MRMEVAGRREDNQEGNRVDHQDLAKEDRQAEVVEGLLEILGVELTRISRLF